MAGFCRYTLLFICLFACLRARIGGARRSTASFNCVTRSKCFFTLQLTKCRPYAFGRESCCSCDKLNLNSFRRVCCVEALACYGTCTRRKRNSSGMALIVGQQSKLRRAASFRLANLFRLCCAIAVLRAKSNLD